MVNIRPKKVGIIACSGEELAEGTVSRLAALKVLEKLHPDKTVTLCLPLFLAGGEGDRAFAKYYPTIALDGCSKRCAARGTEKYSSKPSLSVVVSEFQEQRSLPAAHGVRRLDEAGLALVDELAAYVAEQVDLLLPISEEETGEENVPAKAVDEKEATCSCGSGIPVRKVRINDREMTIVALPLIYNNLIEDKQSPSPAVIRKIMEMVKVYNSVSSTDEPVLLQFIQEDYPIAFKQGVTA